MVTGPSGVDGVNAAAVVAEDIDKEQEVAIRLRRAAQNPALVQTARCTRAWINIVVR